MEDFLVPQSWPPKIHETMRLVVHRVQEVSLFDWDSGTDLRRTHIQILQPSEAIIVLNGNV